MLAASPPLLCGLLLLLLLPPSSGSLLLGWVSSPGYPSGYPPHSSLNWSRCADRGHALSFRLVHLDMEDSKDCQNDALQVYRDGGLIAALCGQIDFEELQSTVNPSLVSTPGGCLSLSFHSDYSNTRRFTGFRGFYTVQDFDECEEDTGIACSQFCHNYVGGYYCSCAHGYHLEADKHTCTATCSEDLSGRHTGVISSPLWPQPYASDAKCEYKLSVEEHLQLQLHFSEDFDVERDSDDSCVDSISVRTPVKTLGPFCGHTAPPSPLHTYAHQVTVVFNSDGSGSNMGFSLRYTTTNKVCVGEVMPHSILVPQKPEYQPGETVTVTCDLGYVVASAGGVEQYETTCLKNGRWSPQHECKIWDCGTYLIPPGDVLQLKSGGFDTLYGDQIQFTCSSSHYTLVGTDTYICNASGYWVSADGKTDTPRCAEVCGKPETNAAATARILGGEIAEMNQIPWQLAIREPRRGGASLISDRWAVTAAHVVEKANVASLSVYGGLIYVSAAQMASAVSIPVDMIVTHPGYVKGLLPTQRINYDNDIALIRFASRVTLSPSLLPICLPAASNSYEDNEQGTISGWGLNDRDKFSVRLNYASLPISPSSKCQDTPVLSNGQHAVFTSNMFCAEANGRDSCKGDSGGPFVLPMLGRGNQGNSGPYRLTGIVSWGPPCSQRAYRGYYTKVEKYVDWIQDTVDKNR